jgi:arsenate reductase
MAEGFFRRILTEKGLDKAAEAVRSAGTEQHGLNPRAVNTMAEVGVDISGHTSDNVQQYLNDHFDYVITVCDNAAEACPVFPGDVSRLHWPFDDPAKATGTEDEIMAEFGRVRDEIRARIAGWLDEQGL